MRVLLDESFPVQLHRRLSEEGYEVDHMILLGQRGAPDSDIRRRLADEDDLVFLTQDTEFEQLSAAVRGTVIISRVGRACPSQRVELWMRGLRAFLASGPQRDLFALDEVGEVVAWGP